jgi:hypothetical protein|tara:strand:+ start:4682 stop:5191 length:510 start_codon:yes stop_codon:yes gene_type:complete
MKLGNCKIIISFFILSFYGLAVFAEEKVLSSPLINLNELKPSFEEVEESNDGLTSNEFIKNKKKDLPQKNVSSAKLIGLDKITAKTSEIIINLGEVKKFGPLEIKVLKCGKVDANNLNNSVAYLQVKDSSVNKNEKVFIFNGWTFSSDPTIAPFDHAIYDLQLVNCNNV